MKTKIDYAAIAKRLMAKFQNRQNKEMKYEDFMVDQLLKMARDNPKLLTFNFLEELNIKMREILPLEYMFAEKYFLDSLSEIIAFERDDIHGKNKDLYLHAIEYYIDYHLNGNRVIGDTLTAVARDFDRMIYKMCKDEFTKKKFRTNKTNQYFGCVSSKFAKVLFANRYPHCTWLYEGEDDSTIVEHYDLMFMGAYPTKIIGEKKELQILEDDDGKEYEEWMKRDIPGIDEDQYEKDLKTHLKRIKADGLLVTPLASMTLLTMDQQNRLAGIWKKNNVSIRMIGKFNNSRVFFILQRGRNRHEKYAILDFCMSKESSDENIILQSDYMRLRKLIENVRKAEDAVPELQNIESGIEYAGSIEDVKRIQDENDSIRRKIQIGFREYNGNQLVDNNFGIREYNPKSNYGKIDMPVPCIYFPKKDVFFQRTGIAFSLHEMYEKICLSHLNYSMFDLEGIKWFEYCRKINEDQCDKALRSTILDTPWDQLNEHGPWFLTRDYEDVNWIEQSDPAYGSVGSVGRDDECYGDAKPTMLFFPETLLMDEGVCLRTIQKNECNYKLWFPFVRNDLEIDYSPFQMILSEIIKSNIYIVPIDRDIVSVEYLKLYMQTILGRKFLNDWKELCKDGGVMDAFNRSRLYMPKLERQKTLLIEYKAAETIMRESLRQKAQARQVELHTLNVIGGKDSLVGYQSVNNTTRSIIKDKSLFENIHNLPQPLAAVLYLNACDRNITQKINNLIHFFEASAAFHATVLLSIIYHYDNDKKMSHRIVKACFKKPGGNASDRTIHNIRTDFGTWTSICEQIVSELKSYNGDNIDNDAFLLSKQCLCSEYNRKLIDLLQEGKKFRNWDAHGGRKTDWNEKNFHDELEALAEKLKEMILDTYSSMDMEFGYDLSIVSNGRERCMVTGYDLTGENPQLKYFEEPVDWQISLPLSASKIHIKIGREFIPMLPFAVLGDLAGRDSQLKCMHYLDAIIFCSDEREYGEVDWHSFDCGDQSILRYTYNQSFLPAQQLIEFFHDSFCK